MRFRWLWVASFVFLLVAACNGGDGSQCSGSRPVCPRSCPTPHTEGAYCAAGLWQCDHDDPVKVCLGCAGALVATLHACDVSRECPVHSCAKDDASCLDALCGKGTVDGGHDDAGRSDAGDAAPE